MGFAVRHHHLTRQSSAVHRQHVDPEGKALKECHLKNIFLLISLPFVIAINLSYLELDLESAHVMFLPFKCGLQCSPKLKSVCLSQFILFPFSCAKMFSFSFLVY